MAYLKYSVTSVSDSVNDRVLITFSVDDARGVTPFLHVVRRKLTSVSLIDDPELLRIASKDDVSLIPWKGLRADDSLFKDITVYEGVDNDLLDNEVVVFGPEDSAPNSMVYRPRRVTIPYTEGDGRKIDALVKIYPMMLESVYNSFVSGLKNYGSGISISPSSVTVSPLTEIVFSVRGGGGSVEWGLESPIGAPEARISKTGKTTCTVEAGVGSGTLKLRATDTATKMRAYSLITINPVSGWNVSGEMGRGG